MKPRTDANGLALFPKGKGAKIIAHLVRQDGAWDTEFARKLSARSIIPEQRFRWFYGRDGDKPAQAVHFAQIDAETAVANVLAILPDDGGIDWRSLTAGLVQIASWAITLPAAVHLQLPEDGLGAHGRALFSETVNHTLSKSDIMVTVYSGEPEGEAV